jgi:DNA-binding beta-propeller fold protein YncE
MTGRNGWLGAACALVLTAGPAMAADSALAIIPCRQLAEIQGEMTLPSDVSVDQRRRVYVLDGVNNLVRIFDEKGAPLGTLGGKGVFSQPLGLDVSPAGDVLVADSGNHRLVFFAAGDAAPSFLKLPPSPDGRPSKPTDVCFLPQKNAFAVVDNGNHRIILMEKGGKVRWTRGVMGRNPGEFRFPFLAASDDQGNIYVTETINTRVQVLRPDGEFKRFIGEWGIDPGQFYRPKGVAISDKGEVFVSDSYLGVIQKFDRDGKLLGAVGTPEGKIRKFQTPVGVVSQGGLLFVVEMIENRVLVRQLPSGKSP